MAREHQSKGISRRQFVKFTGGALGLAALGSMDIWGGLSDNKLKIKVGKISKQDVTTDVLVIGGGMAGLFAAVKAHDAGAKVMLVSKGRLGASGQTPFAKGMFVYDPNQETLSLDEFVNKVSQSAMGTNNPVYTRQMAEHSLDRIKDLKSWGFFDSALYHKSFSKPIEEREIPIHERVMVTHLLKEEGRIVGAAAFRLDQDKILFYQAKSVILCSGAGGFKPNGFPICDLTHDGTAMAYQIGAKVTGKEWNDGHPGQMENPADCFNGWHGMFERKPSVAGIGIRHDLGVDLNYQAYMGGSPVMDGPPGGPRRNQFAGGPKRPKGLDDPGRGPGGPDASGRPDGRPEGPKGQKGPPGRRGTPVGGSSAGMSIHKSEGLVPMDDKCASNIPGLYAAGDALGSHMAGGIYTQIGSSLTGSAVQGAIAGEAAANYAKQIRAKTISARRRKEVSAEILAPLKRKKGYSPAWVIQTLQGIMIPNFVLYIKKEPILKAALSYIGELRDHHIPLLKAADMHELRLAHETANMVLNAEMKLKSSILRTESRCSHYRLDYPEVDDEHWKAWINIFKGKDGAMQFEKQNFDAWPLEGTLIPYDA